MLWDDDAEGGDSLRLVLMEREAAAAYSHNLAREGETDSASFRLRGEEWDGFLCRGRNLIRQTGNLLCHSLFAPVWLYLKG